MKVPDLGFALRERYRAPEWAIFFEVANGPGSTLRRYADAIAMSLFPSRGLDLHGFEIKQSRSDWLHELKQPEKAEEIASYCDYWWIVVPDKALVKLDEMPAPWGLISMQGKVLRQIKAAKRLEPKPLDRKIVAAILRRAHEEATNKKQNDKRAHEEYQRGLKMGEENAKWERQETIRELKELRKGLDEFEKKSGLKIDGWTGHRLGEAVDSLFYLKDNDSAKELDDVASEIEKTAQNLRRKAKALKDYRKENEKTSHPAQQARPL